MHFKSTYGGKFLLIVLELGKHAQTFVFYQYIKYFIIRTQGECKYQTLQFCALGFSVLTNIIIFVLTKCNYSAVIYVEVLFD